MVKIDSSSLNFILKDTLRYFMNLHILIKPLFFIYCLGLISGIQQDFGRDFTAQAQNTVVSSNNLTNLSPQEKNSLKQGKVILKGQKGIYLGQVETTGNLNQAWSVLTDYDNFERFLPNIASSKIISAKGDRILFEQVNVVDLWLFKQKFTVQVEAIKTKPNKIDFKIVDGDLKKLVGQWQIKQISPGKILLSHAVEVEPGDKTEKPLFYGVYESALEETLKAIAQEITKRSQV
jgi:ribosome-associated toxin RatA of RatAB toxin-antitoxin module